MSYPEIEARYRELKAQFDAGMLTEDAFKAQLAELMLQDDQGRWWIIGYETGDWYVYEGEQWVRAVPPAPGPDVSELTPAIDPLPGTAGDLPASGVAAATPPAIGEPISWRKLPSGVVTSCRRLLASLRVPWGALLAITIGWGIAFLVVGLRLDSDSDPAAAFGLAGLIGGAATALICHWVGNRWRWYQLLLLPAALSLTVWVLITTLLQDSDAGETLPLFAIAWMVLVVLVLRWTNPSARWRQLTIVAVAWPLAGAIGFPVADVIARSADEVLAWGVWGLVVGVLGGGVTLAQLARWRYSKAVPK